jgi:predicted lipoprotein with Yx(FWY)xxD motif
VRLVSLLLIAGALVLAGCGEDDTSPASKSTQTPAVTTTQSETTAAQEQGPSTSPAKGTTITLGESDFGEMLYDTRKQAIYIFEKDPKGESVCHDECAEAWPPVYTKGEPKASGGVKASLLGTIKRSDGRRQVTYAGKPLYFYAHEKPGQVLCHNVNLNGGLWWVVGADGRRRP